MFQVCPRWISTSIFASQYLSTQATARSIRFICNLQKAHSRLISTSKLQGILLRRMQTRGKKNCECVFKRRAKANTHNDDGVWLPKIRQKCNKVFGVAINSNCDTLTKCDAKTVLRWYECDGEKIAANEAWQYSQPINVEQRTFMCMLNILMDFDGGKKWSETHTCTGTCICLLNFVDSHGDYLAPRVKRKQSIERQQ